VHQLFALLVALGTAASVVVGAVWWIRRPLKRLPWLRNQVGGHIEDGAVEIKGIRILPKAGGKFEASLTVRTPGSVSVRTGSKGLHTSGDAHLLQGGARKHMAGIGYFELKDHQLTVVGMGPPKSFVERVRKIERAFEWTWLAHWRAEGRARGLHLDDDDLEGRIQGMKVDVKMRKGETRIRVRTSLRPFVAMHKDHADEVPGAAPTGLPVLDMCVSVSTEETVDEGVVEKLLKVVHAWPGSRVDREGVVMRIPGLVTEELGKRIDEVVDLAQALRESR